VPASASAAAGLCGVVEAPPLMFLLLLLLGLVLVYAATVAGGPSDT
jgi:hypothetical protein